MSSDSRHASTSSTSCLISCAAVILNTTGALACKNDGKMFVPGKQTPMNHSAEIHTFISTVTGRRNCPSFAQVSQSFTSARPAGGTCMRGKHCVEHAFCNAGAAQTLFTMLNILIYAVVRRWQNRCFRRVVELKCVMLRQQEREDERKLLRREQWRQVLTGRY